MNERRDIRPDAQAFDEVRFKVVPRYKESELSGDEWRISVHMECYRKGQLKHEERVAHDMESAAAFMGYKYAIASESGGQFYGGEDDFCDQESCAKKATWKARKKFDYERQSGRKSEEPSNAYRLFCDQHKVRGDCGLDDADSNYEFSKL